MAGTSIMSRIKNFYSRPCGRGDFVRKGRIIWQQKFLLTPLREGRRQLPPLRRSARHFYSRPCGRGDPEAAGAQALADAISTHAPAGGATTIDGGLCEECRFLLTPLREGRRMHMQGVRIHELFLLTPLREGRHRLYRVRWRGQKISTHAPAGGATFARSSCVHFFRFLLTPLREGRRSRPPAGQGGSYFYSRPCGRGD